MAANRETHAGSPSIGVRLIAWWLLITCGLGVFCGAALLMIGTSVLPYLPQAQQSALMSLQTPAARFQLLFLAAVSVLGVIIGTGLLYLKTWARALLFLFGAMQIALRIWPFIMGQVTPANGAVIVFFLLFNVFILWFFLRPSVRAQFEKIKLP